MQLNWHVEHGANKTFATNFIINFKEEQVRSELQSGFCSSQHEILKHSARSPHLELNLAHLNWQMGFIFRKEHGAMLLYRCSRDLKGAYHRKTTAEHFRWIVHSALTWYQTLNGQSSYESSWEGCNPFFCVLLWRCEYVHSSGLAVSCSTQVKTEVTQMSLLLLTGVACVVNWFDSLTISDFCR